MNNNEKTNINYIFMHNKKPKKRNYIEYINQYKLFNDEKIKNKVIDNNNNAENIPQPKVLDNIIKYTENLIISPEDYSNSSFYSANSIDENDFNLETSESNEDLIEINECKKNHLENKKTSKKNENKIENDDKIENTNDKLNMETFNKSRPNKKINNGSSSSSDDSEGSHHHFKFNNTLDAYNPSRLNDPLRNIIFNHYNIAPDNLLIIENEGNGNYLYLSISYHIYNNFKHHTSMRNNIANKLTERAEEMPNITINDNTGNAIPLIEYAKKVYNQGEWAGDAEISMIPLIYQDIVVATYQLINDDNSDSILGFKYVHIYGDINDVNKSILILINIKNMHWTCGFYNQNSSQLIIDYIIPSYSLNNNKLYIKNKSNLVTNYLSRDELFYKNKFDDLLSKLNNLK